MDEQELTELEATCEAATPGPWSWDDWGGTHEWWLCSGTPEQIEDDDLAVSIVLSIEGRRLDVDSQDRALIAAAPTAIPALIAEVRRQNERLAVAKLMLAASGQRWPGDPLPVIETEDDGTAAGE